MASNPFTLKEVPTDAAFCDREKEQRDLIKFARAASNTLLYSPRRYGKTSLVKRVQNTLAADDAITAYCDLFGVSSVDEIAGKIAKSIFSITRKSESIFNKAVRLLTSFRPVLSPSADGGISISVQPAYTAGGIELLDETLESLQKFVGEVGKSVHIVLDEFQEITEVENSLAVEGILRSHIQKMSSAFVFVGSRRRILLDMFNNRKRPFFQSAVSYELKTLPRKDLIAFINGCFKQAGKNIDSGLAPHIVDMLGQHPYYTQKFCFFLFDLVQANATQEDLVEAYQMSMDSEKALFESILRQLTAAQITLLNAIAQEPTKKLYAADYMKRHNLKSTGGIQLGLDVLAREDLIEQREKTESWDVVDPLFKQWLQNRSL
jgi:hypothetical protein